MFNPVQYEQWDQPPLGSRPDSWTDKGFADKTQSYNKINLLHPGMTNNLNTYCDQETHSYK